MATRYRIYNKANRSTPIADVSGTTWEAPPLGASETREYLIRTFDSISGLEDQNTDATIRIRSDALGNDVSDAPDRPAALWVEASSPTSVVVRWAWPYLRDWRKPTEFHVWVQAAGSINYALTPDAEVSFDESAVSYRAEITGLTASTAYKVAVRAVNDTGSDDEDNPKDVTTPAASSLEPEDVTTTTTWSG